MIPQSEGPALFEDSYAGEPHFSEDSACGQSRCGKTQTALEVYQRILQRLERQEDTTKAHQNDLKRQIWIASFTGGTIQYHC
ncbi:ventrally expressed gene D protein [Drosophila kikkawai]|uniref:Ventrally expressed gene D protein n=1 Tax=Drosophila kikkawai TaxID=30033 RepID=A0A6P4IF67_DROKI|nr:ventrally expressed gene D protein [Drosophila kikkawai]